MLRFFKAWGLRLGLLMPVIAFAAGYVLVSGPEARGKCNAACLNPSCFLDNAGNKWVNNSSMPTACNQIFIDNTKSGGTCTGTKLVNFTNGTGTAPCATAGSTPANIPKGCNTIGTNNMNYSCCTSTCQSTPEGRTPSQGPGRAGSQIGPNGRPATPGTSAPRLTRPMKKGLS
jgi:hypothetical protein